MPSPPPPQLDSAPPPVPADTDRTQRALGLFLRQTKSFRLAIALHNDPVERDRLIVALTQELAAESIQLLVLDLRLLSLKTSLSARVEELLALHPGSRPVVMVVNLESCVEYNPELPLPNSPGTAFLSTANLQRELFPTVCPAPLILWMTELLERAFIKQAPDLWHWRSHVFDLRTRIRPDQMLTTEDGRPPSNDDHRLHPETRIERLEEELAAYRRTGSRSDEMRILTAIGLARLDAGDARLARNDFDAVLSIASEIDDLRCIGSALGNLGNAHAVLGDTRQAIEFYDLRLDIAREIGDRLGEGNALGNLGIAYKNLGDPHRAIEFHEQALVISREIGDRRGEGSALGNLGIAHFVLGDVRQAIEFYDQQLTISREIGDRRGEGYALFNSALAYHELGQRAEAIPKAHAALAIFKSIENPNTAEVLAMLAKWEKGEI